MDLSTTVSFSPTSSDPSLDVSAVLRPVAARRPVRLNASETAEEMLVPDVRADLSPAQSVERKLTSLLRGGSVPVSHIRLAKLCRNF